MKRGILGGERRRTVELLEVIVLPFGGENLTRKGTPYLGGGSRFNIIGSRVFRKSHRGCIRREKGPGITKESRKHSEKRETLIASGKITL